MVKRNMKDAPCDTSHKGPNITILRVLFRIWKGGTPLSYEYRAWTLPLTSGALYPFFYFLHITYVIGNFFNFCTPHFARRQFENLCTRACFKQKIKDKEISRTLLACRDSFIFAINGFANCSRNVLWFGIS